MSSQSLTDDHKTSQNTTTCVYQTQVGGSSRNVTVVWEKNTMNHSLDISIDSVSSEVHPNHKIDLKPWCFWAKKGCKTIEVDSYQIELYWDFRSANYLASPEPCSDFYVALIHEEEVVLLIGDMKEKVYRKTQTRPAEVEAALVFKKEHIFGKKSFMTRAKFDPNGKECEIVVERSPVGCKDPEMWIRVDGIVVIHIKNLQWKFRGNQTVLINKQPIEVFWDVHTWLFSNRGSGHGLFVFKHDQQESDNDHRDDDKQSGRGTGDKDNDKDNECSVSSNSSTKLRLCLILYAWMID
ncbi:unnamed protein product [Lactuca virosa]|uniref:DUF868 domain-containing protein n=1 Tax=Lactuca virosa TaxID=75947 RepID=A0AAU9MW79_9ASTR|nr:unnamed protein product [Lactuca virosa]